MPSTGRHLFIGATALVLVACGQTIGTPTSYQAPPASCPASRSASFGNSTSPAPDYGLGSGPVYLSGQTDWYSGGQAAIILVDPSYNGPIAIKAAQYGGDGASSIALADEDLPPAALAGLVTKEQQHGVDVVPAASVSAAGAGLTLASRSQSSTWRAWFGRLSTSAAGCYAIKADGDGFSEVIVVWVRQGPAPPG